MTKSDVSKEMAKHSSILLNAEEAAVMIDLFVSVVRKMLAAKKPVYLRGFGAFLPIERKAKKGRDIGRGKTIVIPAHYEPVFKAYPEFKKLLK